MALRHRPTALAILLACALACPITPAAAFNIYKVDPDCVALGAYAHVQDAINAAAANPGTDYVWVANTHSYPESLVIADQDVIIEGGFTDCNDNDIGPSDRSDINGIGGNAAVITISGSSHVFLSNLDISYGNNGIFDGGGIRFTGQGELTLAATTVHDNQASRGGGVYFGATSGPGTLSLLDGTAIEINTASLSGGGIYFEGQARLLLLSLDTQIHANHAASYGGGIFVGALARVDIGAPGYSGGVIVSNHATYGGGIAVGGGAVARIFAHDSMHPTSIAGNTATLYGGAIYAEGDVCLFNPSLSGNDALQGAALFHNGSGGIYLNAGFPSRLGDECGPETVSALGGEPYVCSDISCNDIIVNTAAAGSFGLYGATIYEQGGELIASRLHIEDNSAGYAIQTENKNTDISTCLITNNNISSALVSITGTLAGSASFTGCTFANNTIDGNYVFSLLNGATVSMTRDIIAEPSHLSASAGGTLTVNYTMSNDITTLPHAGNPTVVANDPQFVDTAGRNYRLRPSSPALDFAPAVVADVDFDQVNRSVDLANLPNIFGPTDLGAYERQYLCAADEIFCNGFNR